MHAWQVGMDVLKMAVRYEMSEKTSSQLAEELRAIDQESLAYRQQKREREEAKRVEAERFAARLHDK